MMKVVCNWFHADERVIGEEPGDGISHGICPECRAKLLREAEELRRRKANQAMEREKSV